MKQIVRTVVTVIAFFIALLIICSQIVFAQVTSPPDSTQFDQNILLWNRTDIWSQSNMVMDEYHPLIGDQRAVAYVLRNGTRFSAVVVMLSEEACFTGVVVLQNNKLDIRYSPTGCAPIISLKATLEASRMAPKKEGLKNPNIIEQ